MHRAPLRDGAGVIHRAPLRDGAGVAHRVPPLRVSQQPLLVVRTATEPKTWPNIDTEILMNLMQ
jgi:hypothetical protein